jgi:hypothetical protein
MAVAGGRREARGLPVAQADPSCLGKSRRSLKSWSSSTSIEWGAGAISSKPIQAKCRMLQRFVSRAQEKISTQTGSRPYKENTSGHDNIFEGARG